MLIYRLNYANDVTYGVLLEIAKSVKENKPIDLKMGNVNVIWQGDANEIAIRALHHCSVPAKILNVTGPKFYQYGGLRKNLESCLVSNPYSYNEEQPTALLSNAAECARLFGYPKMPPKKMIELLVEWINQGGKILNKPTHFQERKGKY